MGLLSDCQAIEAVLTEICLHIVSARTGCAALACDPAVDASGHARTASGNVRMGEREVWRHAGYELLQPEPGGSVCFEGNVGNASCWICPCTSGHDLTLELMNRSCA
jgi:hypothetical protein